MRVFPAVLMGAFCALVWSGATANKALASGTPVDDAASEAAFLCANAPDNLVKPIPSPFNLWMVLVCAPQSQALVPAEGMVWFANGTSEPISILALPPDAMPLPKTPDYDPSYGVRFKTFFSSELSGEKLKRAVSILETAQANAANNMDILRAGEAEHVFQLDAVSNIYDMRYNIFFFVQDKVPKAAIACIDNCHKFMYFDILTAKDAKKRTASLPLRP